jgi:arylsulfatase A-like enzyme
MAKHPNILLITSDQQHFSALGAVNPKIKTPALDRLCREGTRFDRAYCPNPTCTPTRASIITGMYPSGHGAWTLGTTLPEDVPTLGDLLQRQGYDATIIGKAHFQALKSAPGQLSIESQPVMRHLEFWERFHGPWYGFNHIEIARMHADESHVGQHYALWMEEKGLKNWADYFWPWPHTDADRLGRKHHWDLPQEFHYTTWTAERSMARMEKCAGEETPFFLWASFHDPHPPYLAPSPWDRMYRPEDMEPGTLEPGEMDYLPVHFKKTQEARPDYSAWQESGYENHGFHSHLQDREAIKKNMAIYYGMTSFMDQQIGRMLDKLDALGLAKDTLVVFTTDHGHAMGHHGLTAKGAFHYEDLIRLPFIVRQPGKVAAGKVDKSLQSLVDLAPTFLSAAGATVPGAMQGVDQLGVWEGRKASARDYAVVENRHQPTKLHLRTYITDRYKLTCYRNETYGELFDLEADPGERRNRWDDPAYASVKAELLLKAVQSEMKRESTRLARVASA